MPTHQTHPPRRRYFRGARIRLAALAALWAALPATAGSFQDPEAIRQTVHAYLKQQVEGKFKASPTIEVGRLDRRLRLKACGQPLKAFLTGQRKLIGATSVGVRCPGPHPWTLYVSARVDVRAKVLVTGRPLGRNHRLKSSDYRLELRSLAKLPYGYFTDPKQVRGMALKRRLNAGDVLRPGLVTQPKLVRRGDRVTVTAKSSAVQIRMSGKALGGGVAGDRVRVRNLSSEQIVEGTVVAPGVVEINL